jgi:hypothetical protein
MLLVEFGLGIDVNLYATLSVSDHGKGILAALVAAVSKGPLALTLHALLGTLLLATGSTAVVRASLTRRPALIAAAVVGLLGLLTAWLSGAAFVGEIANGRSLAMALATAVALLSYTTIVLLSSPPASPLLRGG